MGLKKNKADTEGVKKKFRWPLVWAQTAPDDGCDKWMRAMLLDARSFFPHQLVFVSLCVIIKNVLFLFAGHE